MLRAEPRLYTILLSWGLYLAGRLMLSWVYCLHTPSNDAGADVLLCQRMIWIIVSLLLSYKLYGMLLLAGLWVLYQQRRYADLIVLLGAVGLNALIALMVFDTNRSIAYGFLLYFVALRLITQADADRLNKYLPYIAVANIVLFPLRHYLGHFIHLQAE